MDPVQQKTVAALCTVYRPRSHADVIVSKLLADYTHPHPALTPDPDYEIGRAHV